MLILDAREKSAVYCSPSSFILLLAPLACCVELLLLQIDTASPRGKRDGLIEHISKCENGNWMEKLHYCVNGQSAIQHDKVNLA